MDSFAAQRKQKSQGQLYTLTVGIVLHTTSSTINFMGEEWNEEWVLTSNRKVNQAGYCPTTTPDMPIVSQVLQWMVLRVNFLPTHWKLEN